MVIAASADRHIRLYDPRRTGITKISLVFVMIREAFKLLDFFLPSSKFMEFLGHIKAYETAFLLRNLNLSVFYFLPVFVRADVLPYSELF